MDTTLHFLRLGREYELTGDINIKRGGGLLEIHGAPTMMHKAAVSYYPSYVGNQCHTAIDGGIPRKGHYGVCL